MRLYIGVTTASLSTRDYSVKTTELLAIRRIRRGRYTAGSISAWTPYWAGLSNLPEGGPAFQLEYEELAQHAETTGSRSRPQLVAGELLSGRGRTGILYQLGECTLSLSQIA